MFARFKLPNGGELNVNSSLVTSFEPASDEEMTKLNFLGGESKIVPFTNRAVRHAFKKANTPAASDGADAPEAAG